MKLVKISFFLLTTLISNAQVKLETKDLTNLIAISELYSKNTNAKGDKFAKTIDSLRTPILNHIADALIEVGKGEKIFFTTRFLSRPSNDEMTLWYVIREIHYNLKSNTNKPIPSIDIANEILTKKIDERWLLDNYYYRIHGGIGFLFNSADLSSINIDIETLGLKNDTEKGIFYLNMMEALIGGRFKVLLTRKNNQKILDFCNRLPLFDGKKYFYYKNFDFKDFDWVGFEKTESYNERHIGNLYDMLIIQFMATSDLQNKQEAQEIFSNSILSEQKYFKYSRSRHDLQILYDKLK